MVNTYLFPGFVLGNGPTQLGRYKQWNGLLEWNTGLNYWTELFPFFGQVSVLFFKEPFHCLILIVTTHSVDIFRPF